MPILWVKSSQITPLFRLKQTVCRWVTKPLLPSAFSSGNASAWTTLHSLACTWLCSSTVASLPVYLEPQHRVPLTTARDQRWAVQAPSSPWPCSQEPLTMEGRGMGRILTHRVAGLQSWAHGSEKLGEEPHLVQGSLGFLQYAFSH